MVGGAGTARRYVDALIFECVEQDLGADASHADAQDMRSGGLIGFSVKNDIG